MRTLLLSAAAALFAVSAHAQTESVPSNDGTETPKFAVQASGPPRKEGPIEVRRYEPMIEAYTSVEAPNARAAANKAFMTVASYIFGANEGGSKISMTAPVATTAGTKIDMTAPVTTTGGNTLDEDGTYTIAFMMPSKWTMDTLPAPQDPAVKLRRTLTEVKAALPFKGERDPEAIAKYETQLREWLDANGWTVLGAATLAGYDGPRVPSAQRRYEVQIPVSKS